MTSLLRYFIPRVIFVTLSKKKLQLKVLSYLYETDNADHDSLSYSKCIQNTVECIYPYIIRLSYKDLNFCKLVQSANENFLL